MHAVGQCRGADGHCVSAKCQGLCHVGTIANAAGDDKLHMAMHVEFLQCFDRWPYCCQYWQTDMFDEHFLRRGGAALHAVEHHNVGTRLHCQCGVVIWS